MSYCGFMHTVVDLTSSARVWDLRYAPASFVLRNSRSFILLSALNPAHHFMLSNRVCESLQLSVCSTSMTSRQVQTHATVYAHAKLEMLYLASSRPSVVFAQFQTADAHAARDKGADGGSLERPHRLVGSARRSFSTMPRSPVPRSGSSS